MHYSTTYSSPIGMITIACEDDKIAGLWLEGQKYHGEVIFKHMTKKDNLPLFDAAKKWLDNYFMGKKPNIFDLPLSPKGSEFREEVWNILCHIPYGKVITYNDIAKQIAVRTNKNKVSCQAVGGAVGHNPISIIIPCHRVVGTNGSLTGYAGGIDKKIKLLELEGVDMDGLFMPKKAAHHKLNPK